MKIPFSWEAIDSQTLRARVPGGWLVRFHSHSGGVAMSLVPDSDHAWEAEVPTERVEQYRLRLTTLEHRLKDPYLDAAVKGEVEEEIHALRQFLSQKH